MTGRWITKEEYDALTDEEDAASEESPPGIQVAHTLSGRVLESKAGPKSLEQRDYQGHAITHDLLVHEGLHEEEQSDKTTHYAAQVNSSLTEVAPQICKRYTQNEHYTETYQNKTETIQAETYLRKTDSAQHIKSQDRLNLSVPNQLQVEATDHIERHIGTRDATINHHELTAGESIKMRYGTLTRYDDVTVIRAQHVRLCANHLTVSGGSGQAEKPLQPRRVLQVAPKISCKFLSNTVKIMAYNARYFIQLELTTECETELESLNAIDPASLEGAKGELIAKQVLGQYFYGLELKEWNHFDDLAKTAPTFLIGNQYGEYTLTNGIVLPVVLPKENAYIFKYLNSIETENEECEGWLISLNGKLEVTATVQQRSGDIKD